MGEARSGKRGSAEALVTRAGVERQDGQENVIGCHLLAGYSVGSGEWFGSTHPRCCKTSMSPLSGTSP